MDLKAGVGVDLGVGGGASGAETLGCPADLRGIDLGEVAGGLGGEGESGAGCREREICDVSALGLDDGEEGFVSLAGAEDCVREGCAGFRCGGVACEVEHPAGEKVGEGDEVGGEWVAVLREDIDALFDLKGVADEASDGLIVIGDEGDCVAAGGVAGVDHEAGEGEGLCGVSHEGTGAGFDVEDEGVEGFGELLAHDAGSDEVGVLDGGGMVTERVEDTVCGDEVGSLSDEGGAAGFEDFCEAREGELGVEAGDGFKLV